MAARENTKLRSALRWLFFLTAMVLVCSPSSRGQSMPNAEASANYSFVRGYGDHDGGSFNMSGGSASIAFNFKPWIGLVQDDGTYFFTGPGSGLHAQMYTYLLGPRFSRRRPGGRFTPFAQVLLGGSHITAKETGVKVGETAFAVAAGGGLDAAISRHFSVRVAQVEYLRTRFDSETGGSASQNNFRFSAGLVVRFGTSVRDQ
jgi:opacity protein-like surface antigen